MESSLEMNSHADSPVIGSEALIVRTHDKKDQVNGFANSLGTKTVDVMDAALGYEYEFTGYIYIMIVRNTLYSKKIGYHLIAPFIIILAGVEGNKQPKFMNQQPTTKHHSVFFPNDNICLPLSIKGILSYLPTRKPILAEYNKIETQLELTPPFTEWNPHKPSYGISENCMLDYDGNIIVPHEQKDVNVLPTRDENKVEVGVSSIMTDISEIFEPWSLSRVLEGTY